MKNQIEFRIKGQKSINLKKLIEKIFKHPHLWSPESEGIGLNPWRENLTRKEFPDSGTLITTPEFLQGEYDQKIKKLKDLPEQAVSWNASSEGRKFFAWRTGSNYTVEIITSRPAGNDYTVRVGQGGGEFESSTFIPNVMGQIVSFVQEENDANEDKIFICSAY